MTQPLQGRRIVVTRPRSQAHALAEAIEQRGGEAILFPTIAIVPAGATPHERRCFESIHTFDWVVFTSVNGVAEFWRRLEERKVEGFPTDRTRVAAIGPATADELERRGVAPAFVPSVFVADQIPDGLGSVAGRRVLLPRAARARKDLAAELRRRGATVEDLALYDTVTPEPDPAGQAQLERGVDGVTFTSSSTVEHFVEMLGPSLRAVVDPTVVACIGPITAATAERLGLPVHVVAREYTTHGLVRALCDHFATSPTSTVTDPGR